MPIEIKTSSETILQRISNSIIRLQKQCKLCFQTNEDIFLTDLDNVSTLFPSKSTPNEYEIYKKFIADGFGIATIKTFQQGKKHILILNFENIDRLSLNESELDGVIAHELGHILNEPDPVENIVAKLKSELVMSQISLEDYKEKITVAELTMQEYQKNKEFYADYFAKLAGCDEGLLSSFKKYLKQDKASNTELFMERIAKLKSNEVFKGSTKKI